MEKIKKTAEDVMSHKLVFIDGMDTVKEAVDLIRKENVNALMVKKRNQNDALGIMTVSDVIKKVYNLNLDPKEVNVFEIMTKPAISIPHDMNLRYIPRLMLRAKIQSAPVDKMGECIGMIYLNNLLHEGYLI
ncbi:CBS domain-containing protein [Cecembia sp.]|uniref:CBS domain-containing protein n=1 Tax=Cecembia sp. TaxID=1898110 RepID=UPI0025B954F3|nr:CBS domain-containing protein [Cecembia sp.]